MINVYQKSNRKSLTKLIFTLLFTAAIGFAIFFYCKYNSLKNDPNILAKQEAVKLTQKISQFVELPKNEEPSVATIIDKNKLKGQLFFTNSENGDKLLIFAKAGKAVLYRPSTNKIITVAPINLQTQR